MTDRICEMKDYIFDKRHHALRAAPLADAEALARTWQAEGVSPMRRAALRFAFMMQQETPAFIPGAQIAFMRTQPTLPALLTQAEWAEIRKTHSLCELGRVFNLSGDYALILREGFGGRRKAAQERLLLPCTEEEREYLEATLACLDALLSLCGRYAAAAEDAALAERLRRVPREGARTFLDALQLIRIMQYALWCAGHYHNTWGRFDQYMLPYYQASLSEGIPREMLFEQVEEFFLTLNLDSDLYVGMQQGDNGQSMVLGGVTPAGEDACNPLTYMALEASLELKLIDPKINLRVNGSTPMALYSLGTRLTREGLGFPQYTNDDVAIPALIDWGYAPEDARNYVMAACWELIIPGVGMDVVNIGALSLAEMVRNCACSDLASCADMAAFVQAVRTRIAQTCAQYPKAFANLYMEPAPVYSLFMDGCIENAHDCAQGLKYNNYGVHGTGFATAADSMAAIDKLVFREKSVSPARLIRALETDFAQDEALRGLLLDCPRTGNDDARADDMLCLLTDAFADGLAGLRNDRGGIFRPGTGSAMFYVTHGEALGATPDGRHAGAWLSANFSPALDVKLKGPLSVVRSFSKPALKRVCNGGPLTLELHDTVFQTEAGIQNVAHLVRLFIARGGHQLQLNTIDREKLYEAQKHPEAYRNLIVRVWGWSGYFVELDRVYQDHVIKRVEFSA